MIGTISFTLNQRLNNHITDMIGEAMAAAVEDEAEDRVYDELGPDPTDEELEEVFLQTLEEIAAAPADLISNEHPRIKPVLKALSFLARAYSLSVISDAQVERFIAENPTRRQKYKQSAA